MKRSITLSLLFGRSFMSTFNLGLISDSHMNTLYHWQESNPGCLNFKYDWDHAIFAPLGRIGCDPPAELISAIVESMSENSDGPLDAILFAGDTLPHYG
jgi:hypothetical protein